MAMKAWRDRKGGLKPPAPPVAPTVLEHWMEKWREAMAERGVRRSTSVCQLGHARSFIRWCHGRGIRDPSWISTGLVQSWLCDLEGVRTRWGTPLTCATIDGAVGSVRRFLGFMAERRAIPWNPLAARCGRRRVSRPLPVVLDEKTVASVLEAPDTPTYSG